MVGRRHNALLVLVALTVIACSPGPSATPTATATVTQKPLPSLPATMTPAPTAVPRAALANPGGTCAADQFVLTSSPATHAYGYSTVDTRVVFFRQPMRNTGKKCSIRLPTRLGVLGAGGETVVVRVGNAGTATSFAVPAGKVITLVLGAWWPIANAQNADTWCRDPVADVTRVSFPFASGVISFDLGMTLPEVCPSPASMSATIE